MNYDRFFDDELRALKDEGRYRVFADLERQAGRYPRALCDEGDLANRKYPSSLRGA